MKKFLIAALSAVLVIVLCAPVSANVINSNHYIDYQRFNDDESEWEVYGWTVVDTEIVRIGYVLDGMEFVWVVDEVDSRSNANNMAPNDCFFDDELYAAIASMGLANGLADYYSYRIHITLDTLAMEKGEHMIEVAAEYSDGSLGNPFRNNTIEFTKANPMIRKRSLSRATNAATSTVMAKSTTKTSLRFSDTFPPIRRARARYTTSTMTAA